MDANHLSAFQKGVIGVQFLFVAFGSTVLVPLLVGLDPSTALLTAGIGTLIFHLVTKGIVPIFLGSSFAFIAPIIKASELYGMAGALSGMVAVGAVYGLMSLLVKLRGTDFIKKLFPPIVIGPVIILIGLSLAGSGVKMASENWVLALISLITAVIVSLKGRGLLKLIPIFCGIIVGYLVALLFYNVDTAPIKEAAWFALPQFVTPDFSWAAIIYMVPAAIAPVIEHIGDVYAVNSVAGKDFVKNPGLHRTLLGMTAAGLICKEGGGQVAVARVRQKNDDGLACVFAGLVGGPPVTTYSEVTGAVSLTKVTNPAVIRIAAVTGIVFSVFGKISALLKSIPASVLGGIMLLLFGTIASLGMSNLIQNKVDLSNTRNMIIVSLILTFGIGGAAFEWGNFSMSGIGLAALLGVILNLILPTKESKA